MPSDINKTNALVAYVAKNHGTATITSLIKLAYLIDYVSMKKRGYQISSFNYCRWHFGPFDQSIYEVRDALLASNLLESKVEYNTFAEYQVYSCDTDVDMSIFSEEEMAIIDGLLLQTKGYGPKMLTDVAYTTPPMVKIGAKIDNKEGIGTTLDLNI